MIKRNPLIWGPASEKPEPENPLVLLSYRQLLHTAPSLGMHAGGDKKPSTKIPSWKEEGNFLGGDWGDW